MIQPSNMETTVLRFVSKEPNSDGKIIMEPDEIQAIVRMLYATYNKVNQLCSDLYRIEYERGVGGSNYPFASRNPFL